MAVRRVETDEHDPFARGAAVGRATADGVVWNLGGYRDLFRAVGVADADLAGLGEAALERISQWAPRLGEEARGVAAGAGVQPWEVGLLNARTEVLATVGAIGEGECSTVVALADGRSPRTMQTWDWHDVSHEDQLVLRAGVRPGHEVRCFTEFGILGKIGVSSAGLGVHFNILNHTADGSGVGVPVHCVARRLLDDAEDLAGAVDIATSARVSASSVLTVVTAAGEAASVELSPEGAAVVGPGPHGVLVHTNHFLDPGLAGGEAVPGTSNSYPRLEHLRARADRLDVADPVERAMAMVVHESDGAAVCCHADPALPPEHRWQTLITIGLDVGLGRLEYHEGGPCAVTRSGWQVF